MAFVTIDGFEALSKQAIFDKCAAHLLTQMEKSKLPGADDAAGVFFHNKLRCAAGIFLDKDKCKNFGEAFNNKSWYLLLRDGFVPSHESTLITQLQYVHDTCLPTQWSNELYSVATDNKLSPAILENYP